LRRVAKFDMLLTFDLAEIKVLFGGFGIGKWCCR
jgi:hypothetical protein